MKNKLRMIFVILPLIAVLVFSACGGGQGGSSQGGKEKKVTQEDFNAVYQEAMTYYFDNIDALLLESTDEWIGKVQNIRATYEKVEDKTGLENSLEMLQDWEERITINKIIKNVTAIDLEATDIREQLDGIFNSDEYVALTDSGKMSVKTGAYDLIDRYETALEVEADIETLASLTGNELRTQVNRLKTRVEYYQLDSRFVKNLDRLSEAENRYYMETAAGYIAKIEDTSYEELVAKKYISVYKGDVSSAQSALEKVPEDLRTSVEGYEKLQTAILYCQAVPVEAKIVELTKYKSESVIKQVIEEAVELYNAASDEAKAIVTNIDTLRAYHAQYLGTLFDDKVVVEYVYRQFGDAFVEACKQAGNYAYYGYSIEDIDGVKTLVLDTSFTNLDTAYSQAKTKDNAKTQVRTIESTTASTVFAQTNDLLGQAVTEMIGSDCQYALMYRLVHPSYHAKILYKVWQGGTWSSLD